MNRENNTLHSLSEHRTPEKSEPVWLSFKTDTAKSHCNNYNAKGATTTMQKQKGFLATQKKRSRKKSTYKNNFEDWTKTRERHSKYIKKRHPFTAEKD